VAAEALGVTIGGGLAISGAWNHAFDIQGSQGTSCPVSASIENVSINGPNDATPVITGVFHRNASLKVGTIRQSHVTTGSDGDR
jgi:hypothetical protein